MKTKIKTVIELAEEYCKHNKIDIELLKQKHTRKREIIVYRQAFEYLAFEVYKFNIKDIYNFTGKHRTVIYNSVKNVKDMPYVYNDIIKCFV